MPMRLAIGDLHAGLVQAVAVDVGSEADRLQHLLGLDLLVLAVLADA